MGDLGASIGYALRRAQIGVFADFHERCAGEDIRPAQYSVLQVLKANPGRRQGEVSAALGIQRTNFVPLLDSLERRGLAERRPVPTDRRASALWLTAAGAALLDRLEAVLAGHEAYLEAKLGGPAATAALLAMLRRLTGPA